MSIETYNWITSTLLKKSVIEMNCYKIQMDMKKIEILSANYFKIANKIKRNVNRITEVEYGKRLGLCLSWYSVHRTYIQIALSIQHFYQLSKIKIKIAKEKFFATLRNKKNVKLHRKAKHKRAEKRNRRIETRSKNLIIGSWIFNSLMIRFGKRNKFLQFFS